MHLDERASPGLLDVHQHVAARPLVGREPAPHAAHLEHHRAHAVGDDVVQLARDPRPFLGDRLAGSLLALLLEDRRLALELRAWLVRLSSRRPIIHVPQKRIPMKTTSPTVWSSRMAPTVKKARTSPSPASPTLGSRRRRACRWRRASRRTRTTRPGVGRSRTPRRSARAAPPSREAAPGGGTADARCNEHGGHPQPAELVAGHGQDLERGPVRGSRRGSRCRWLAGASRRP